MRDFRMITKINRNMILYKNRISTNEKLNSTSYECVRYISKHPGICANQLCDYLSLDKALISRTLNYLLKEDYIKIMIDDKDKRRRCIYPTPKAYKEKAEEVDFEVDYFNYISRNISKEELDYFFNALEKLYFESKSFRKRGFKK